MKTIEQYRYPFFPTILLAHHFKYLKYFQLIGFFVRVFLLIQHQSLILSCCTRVDKVTYMNKQVILGSQCSHDQKKADH